MTLDVAAGALPGSSRKRTIPPTVAPKAAAIAKRAAPHATTTTTDVAAAVPAPKPATPTMVTIAASATRASAPVPALGAAGTCARVTEVGQK